MPVTVNLTVVVPTTGERVSELARALSSVAAQTLQPQAVLVVVDGDEATRRAVAARLRDSVDRVLHTGSRRGVSAARNLGARAATTPMLAFLDDDDRWKPSHLERAFAEGEDVDIVLSAFEKHNAEGVHLEKVPPPRLRAEDFFTRNPGLRGSNLVVRAEVFARVGGFDEGFPSFNDVDFGARVFALPGLRYRAVSAPTVEYYAHQGDRLSKRGAATVAPGLRAFLTRYGAAMSESQLDLAVQRAMQHWGINARSPQFGDTAKSLPALDAAVLDAVAAGDDAVDAALDAARRACQRASIAAGAWSLERLRVVVITTDSPGRVEGLIESLRQARREAGWATPGRGPRLELLCVENDTQSEVVRARRRYLAAVPDEEIAVTVLEVSPELRPLSTGRARAAAMRAVVERGWVPAPCRPVWMLDEDLRFEQLLPSLSLGFRAARNPSLLHRIPALLRDNPWVDVLIGGNSGAAPVPAVGLLRRQIEDLRDATGTAPWEEPSAAVVTAWEGDTYYEFAEASAPPRRPWRVAWWREDGIWDWSEVASRLARGVPVTRPAMAAIERGRANPWGPFAGDAVAGGNTLLVTDRALRPEWLQTVRWRGVSGRRADAVWCARASYEGVRVARVSIPLLHDRLPRSSGTGDDLARDALSDALGVGAYRTVRALGSLEPAAIAAAANTRVRQTVAALKGAREALDAPALAELAALLMPALREGEARLSEVNIDDVIVE